MWWKGQGSRRAGELEDTYGWLGSLGILFSSQKAGLGTQEGWPGKPGGMSPSQVVNARTGQAGHQVLWGREKTHTRSQHTPTSMQWCRCLSPCL